jgi:hypothetical protein
MFRLISHYVLALFLLVTLGEGGNVHAANAKSDGQAIADNIASFTSKAIYNLDTDQIVAVLESYLNEKPEVRALTITESIDQEQLLTYFRKDNKAVYGQSIPEELLKLESFFAVSMFDGEQIGTVKLYYANTPSISLSAEELTWIADHPRIRVHNEMDWPPFNFAEAGEPKGFSIDMMNLLASKVGIKVDYITGPSWNDFIEMMKSGELDVMLNIVKTPEREKFLLYTPPYANNPNTILSHHDNLYRSINQLSGKTVAVPKGFFYEEILKRDFPR